MEKHEKWKYYWGVKVDKSISSNEEIYLYADSIQITDDGHLVFAGKDFPVLIISAGKWVSVFAASIIDGCPVSVEHWKGQVE